jgi:hypothetical protein
MQGAENGMVLSDAPEPSCSRKESLGKRRRFFGGTGSGGVWSAQKMAQFEAGLDHVSN